MSSLGQHPGPVITTPVNTGPLDADVVRGHLQGLAAPLTAHDADRSIHVLSGLLAARPAAGVEGSLYIQTDYGGSGNVLWYDNGSTWEAFDFAVAAHTHAFADLTAKPTTLAGYGIAVTAADIAAGSFPSGGTHVFTGDVRADRQAAVKRHTIGNLGSTPTIDWNNGLRQRGTLNANATMAFSNPVVGAALRLELLQDATGSRLVSTYPTGTKWPSGVAPTLTVTPNRKDVLWYECVSASPPVFHASVESFNLDDTT